MSNPVPADIAGGKEGNQPRYAQNPAQNASEAEAPNAKRFELNDYGRCGALILMAYCAVSPFSIALSQIVIGLLLAYTIYFFSTQKAALKFQVPSELKILAAPILCWLLVSGASSLFGLNPTRSILEFLNSGIFLTFPFLVFLVLSGYKERKRLKVIYELLSVLAISLGLASIHSIIETAFNTDLPIDIPGPLTESGQTVLIIPCLLALSFIKKGETKFSPLHAGLFASLILFAWPSSLSFISPHLVQGLSAIVALGFVALLARKSSLPSLITLICVGFVVNLKRGPWVGALVSAFILSSFLSKKLFIIAGFIFVAAFLLLSPVRERTLSISEHYLIDGGRHEMWTLGLHIIERFPLGVGLDNADVIRKFNPQLPETHRHMHNNFLNVAVELGWLGLLVYAWWMYSFIRIGILNAKKQANLSERDICLLAFSTAILGWQVAGIAEYNFGDSEIKLLAFMIMGFIMALSFKEETQTVS